MRVQESKICVCESSKRQEIIASQNAMLRQARKPGASSGKLSWHPSQLKAGGISTCTGKPAEMNLFKYAKVMSYHDGHKHLRYVQIFAVSTA